MAADSTVTSPPPKPRQHDRDAALTLPYRRQDATKYTAHIFLRIFHLLSPSLMLHLKKWHPDPALNRRGR